MMVDQPSGVWRAKSQTFDAVSALYDAYRPGYPAELVEDVIRISGIPPDGRILEIGSGTGKATILFAQKGYTMLCLEPGQNLIDVAANKLAAYPRVRFANARFEEWEGEQDKFDLVISAQAYHWVPEAVRYEKTAAVLKPRGHLAAFWNIYPGGMDEGIKQELSQAYAKRAPELVKAEAPLGPLADNVAASLRASPYFGNLVVKTYPWSVTYSTSDYLCLLNTYSDHLRLAEERRTALLDDIAAVIERHGGRIERPYLAVVYMAERSGYDSE
jgi:SAM-dependent methyltransferase